MFKQLTMSRRVFRLLLIANWVLIIAAVFAHFISQRALPAELRGWLQAYQRDPQYQVSSGKVLLDLFYIAIQLAVTIGLFTFKRWAKSLLIPVTVLGYLVVGASRVNVDLQWVVSLKSIVSEVYGMIIALVYFSPINREFAKRSID
jgi:hypothetical protein